MGSDDVFGDGEPQAEAAVPAAGGIHAVEALENVFQRRLVHGLRVIGYAQAAVVPVLPFQGEPDRASLGVFFGIIQQNVHQLSQVLAAAGEGNARGDGGFQRQPCFKKHSFKGQQGILGQRREIHLLKDHFRLAVVGSGQLQQVLHQAAHLVGHGEDAVHAAALIFPFGHLQKLCIGHDDGEGCFQFVGGIGYKLPLLIPGLLNRADHPPCQQHRNAQEYPQAQHPQSGAGFGKAQKRCLFTGHIRKDNGLGQGRTDLQKAKIVLRNDPRIPGFGCGSLHKGGEEYLIGQVIVAPHHGGQLSCGADLQQEIGQVHPRSTGIGAAQLEGVCGHRAHHGKALLLQILSCRGVQQPEDGAEHDSYNGHNDAYEPNPKLFQHPSCTSSR